MNARATASLFSFALLSLAGPASALPFVDLGVGVVGLGGASWIDKASDSSAPGASLYPGFVGFRGGLGATLEARALGIVGLEVGFVRSSDEGSGDITIAGSSVSASLGQSATHIPVLLKLVAPLPLVKPFIAGGIDFVSPGACSASFSSSAIQVRTAATCTNASYSMWTGAVGAEFALPIPALDLRVPLSLRYSSHRDFGDGIADRATFTTNGSTITGIDFRSEWRHDAYVTAGVVWFF